MTVDDDIRRENADLRAATARLEAERDKLAEETRELKSKLAAAEAEAEEGGADEDGSFCVACGGGIWLDDYVTDKAHELLRLCDRPLGTTRFSLSDTPEAQRALLALNDSIGRGL